jgi:hypothetical protein
MSNSFDCSFDKQGFGSSFDTERAFLSRPRETERFFLAGERLSLLFEAERSRFVGTADFRDRLRSRRGGDLRRSLFLDTERSRRAGDRLSLPLDTDPSRRAGDFLSLLRDTERSLRAGDFRERLLSLRGGDFLIFRSRERKRRSLDLLRLSRDRLLRSRVRLLLSRERLRLSRERLRLSRTGREFSLDRPLERRTGLTVSSFAFSLASFFLLRHRSLISIAFFSASSGGLIDLSTIGCSLSRDELRFIGLADRLRSLISFLFKISSFFS